MDSDREARILTERWSMLSDASSPNTVLPQHAHYFRIYVSCEPREYGLVKLEEAAVESGSPDAARIRRPGHGYAIEMLFTLREAEWLIGVLSQAVSKMKEGG